MSAQPVKTGAILHADPVAVAEAQSLGASFTLRMRDAFDRWENMSEDERAAAQSDHRRKYAEQRQQADEHAARIIAQWEQATAAADPLIGRLMQLHAPVYDGGTRIYCRTCRDEDGFDDSSAPWPCETARVIGEHGQLDIV